MQNLSVPFRGAHLVMSLAEAEALVKTLNREIESAKRATTRLRPPTVENGYINLDSFYGFFVQLYPTQAQLRNHAAKLFGRIAVSARYNKVNFNVICIQCGLHVREKCTKKNFLHVSCNDDLKIEVASLKQHANDFMTGAFRLVGPAVRNDMKLLLDYL